MTTELVWLTLAALLAASLWIPFIVGVNMAPGMATQAPFTRPPDLTVLPDWVQRANRAHLNMIETLVPFAAVVLIAHGAGVSNQVTIWASVAFFWLRAAHAIGMITGIAGMLARPLIFTASWLCTVAIAVSIILA